MEKHVLVDKTIKQIDLTTDGHVIRFVVEGEEPIIARADADCCSHTWIEHVELPALGFPAKVLSVDSLDMGKEDEKGDDYGDVTAFYGLKITTDKGDIVIDYRNNSNGYYGGSLSWPGEYFYGGVYDQQESNDEFVKLEKDK